MAMWENAKENFENMEFSGIVNRYKKMLSDDRMVFFDVSDFEHIVDHYMDKNQLTNALQACDIAISQHPNSVDVKIKKAQVLLGQMKVAKALNLLKSLIQIESTNAEVMVMLGNCYSVEGEHEKAFDIYKRAEKFSFEDRDEMLYSIGSNYIQLAQFERAIYFLEKSLEANRKNENAMYDLAYAYDKVGMDDKSIQLYNDYLDLDPFSESAWYNLGIVYARREQYDKAIEAYDFALAIDDNYYAAIYNKANTLAACDRYEEALIWHLECLRFDKDSAEIYICIAECYFQLHDNKKAYEYYRIAIKTDPGNADGWYGAGIVLMVEESLKESIVFLKKAIKLEETVGDYWNAYAKVNGVLDNYEEALVAFEKSIELDSFNADFYCSFADFYFQFDQISLSLEILFKAHKRMEDDAQILYRLVAYLYLDNKQKLAQKYFAEALKINFDQCNQLFSDFPRMASLKWVEAELNKYPERKLK